MSKVVDNIEDINSIDSKVNKVSSTDNAVVRFDGGNGQVQNSGVFITDTDNLLVGTTTDNGVDKLQVNGSISADSIKTDGYFEIGKDYPFGDYYGIQNTRNSASMLVMVGGNDTLGAARSALYLVNLKVASGNNSTSAIRIGGDDSISATFYYVGNDVFRVTDTSSASAHNWRYLGGWL